MNVGMSSLVSQNRRFFLMCNPHKMRYAPLFAPHQLSTSGQRHPYYPHKWHPLSSKIFEQYHIPLMPTKSTKSPSIPHPTYAPLKETRNHQLPPNHNIKTAHPSTKLLKRNTTIRCSNQLNYVGLHLETVCMFDNVIASFSFLKRKTYIQKKMYVNWHS